jgi:hypothetical protein
VRSWIGCCGLCGRDAARYWVLRGEPGIGKRALLEYLLEQASGCRIARAAGVQSEMELAFAGLHQLCAPLLDRLDRLPGPQRDALATAFGLSAGAAPNRFLVGPAVLSLFSEAADVQPVVCAVDDAQWLDRPSAQALGFVARRLQAERAPTWPGRHWRRWPNDSATSGGCSYWTTWNRWSAPPLTWASCWPGAALRDVIDDPFLHAVPQLAIAWATPLTGDFDGALRAASAALDELHGQHEPLWTALAVGSLGSMETSAGRSDDALRHLREIRDLADRFDSAWLAGWSRVQLGTVAVMQGRLDQARDLLDDALTRSVEAHSTRSLTLCLIAFARLAFAEGDPNRRRCWPGRPTACSGGSGSGRGRCCGRAKPN